LKLLFKYLQFTVVKILENQLPLSFNATSQHVLCVGDVKLLDTGEHNIEKDIETSFMSAYVLRNLIVSCPRECKTVPKLLTTANKTNPLKMYQNSGIWEGQSDIEILSR
jgi:hypothetical protein